MGSFKISSGIDAETAANKDLVFSSDNDYMIILEERTDQSDGSGNLEITHGLGYIPAFYCMEEISAGVWKPPFANAYADSSKIYVGTYDVNTNVRTVIFGNSQDNATGSGNNNVTGKLKIAKDGYDAETETDLRNMKFASGKGVFKIKESRTLTVSVTSADGTFETQYAHGLGYVPQVYVLLYDTTGVGLPFVDLVGAGVSAAFEYEIDDTNLTVRVINSGGAVSSPATVTFKAHILLDKIA